MRRIRVFAALLIFSTLLPWPAWADAKGGVIRLERVIVGDAYVPRVLGLFIGIQEYNDPVWHDLKYARKDVYDMVDFFSAGNALELDYHLVLTTARETTRDYILNQAMMDFAMKNTSADDVVIVYISSHGTLTTEQLTVIKDGKKIVEPRKVPYILTSDAREGRVPDSAIALHRILDWFEHLSSGHKVLILDMCHSGTDGKSQLSPEQKNIIQSSKGINYVPLQDSAAAILLTSCPMGGTSFEDEQLQNSVYTHFLIEGMRLGDMNQDGAVTISEAHNYAIDKTLAFTWEHKKYRQTPTTYSKILGKDPLVVYGKPQQPGHPTVFSYASANQGVELFVDGKYKGLLPKGIEVPPGERNIALKFEGKTLYQTDIYARKGEDYLLPDVAVLKLPPQTKVRFLLAEGGLRGFQRGDVANELLPDNPIGGASLHCLGSPSRWLGLSIGANYGRDPDVEQVAFRLGLKFTMPAPRLRLSVGPEVMLLYLNYSEAIDARTTVGRRQSFVAPGVEGLLTYQFEGGVVIGLGLRAHYLSYEINEKSYSAWSNEGVVGLGYAF